MKKYGKYFACFGDITEFHNIHFVSNGRKEVWEMYTTNVGSCRGKNLIDVALVSMETRAELIFQSEYVDELWRYFNSNDLFET